MNRELTNDYIDYLRDVYEFQRKGINMYHGGKEDLESHNIHCVEDFYDYADWNADGRDSCYAMGFSFHKYYLTPVEGDTLDNQPDTTFIGYCYKNNSLFSSHVNGNCRIQSFWPYVLIHRCCRIYFTKIKLEYRFCSRSSYRLNEAIIRKWCQSDDD